MIKRQRYKKVNTLLVPLLLLAAGLYLVPIKIFNTDFSKVPGDFGDARFNNYILEHGHRYICGKVDKYWDAPFMYPYPNVIAFSDNLLGTLPVYSAFRISGFDRETSFQLWLLTLFALNFICCYWVLNRWSNNSSLAAVGAYIFAFSIFVIGHIYNVQSFPRFIVPFVFYWIWKYLSQKKIKYFLFTCLGTVFQFYCGIYLGFLLIYSILFLIIAYIIVYRDNAIFGQFKKTRIILHHLLIILLAAILLAPLMLPYIKMSLELGMRTFEEIVGTIPTMRSYFFTSNASITWRFLSEHGKHISEYWWCHFLFIGGLPWMGIIAASVILLSQKTSSEKKKFIGLWTFGLFLSIIFCLNIDGFTLYRIIYELPGFSCMRSLNRIINTEVMFFILIFVFVFNELSKTSRVMRLIITCFPLLIMVDNLIDSNEIKVYDKHESQKQIETVKKKILRQYERKYKAIAYKPEFLGENKDEKHLAVMLAAQELNIACVNAYTASYPVEYLDFIKHADNKGLQKWCKFNNTDRSLIQKINESGTEEMLVNLKAINGKYVCADESLNHIVIANREKANQWETFTFIVFEKNKCALKSFHHLFLSCQNNHQKEIIDGSNEIGTWETFEKIELDSNYVAFKAFNGKYISFDGKSLHLFAKSDSIGNDEKFKLVKKDED